MSRIWSWFAGALLVLAIAVFTMVGGAPAANAGPGDGACYGDDFSTCTWEEDGGMPASGGFGDDFAGFFVLALFAGVGITIWKVSTARRMARDSGMNETDATTMTLLTDDGFEATYLAANLRGQTGPAAPEAPPTSSVADRLKELGDLRDQGLITPEEYDARRAAIIDSV